MKITPALLHSGVVCAAMFSCSTMAIDWRLGVGGHDYYVDEADSHTFGAHVYMAFEHQTDSSLTYNGELTVHLDRDKDELDPDHIPIWFSSGYGVKGNLVDFSDASALTWDLTLVGKRNTVSSVEKQFKLFPTLGYQYQTDTFSADVKAGAGYYFLEIDDDVPRTRGYDREDFRNKTGAYTLAANTEFALSKHMSLGFSGQTWNDGDDWLEHELAAEFRFSQEDWKADSELVFNLTYTTYNLTPYDNRPTDSPGYLPILPWNKDLLLLIYFEMPWG
ncbi:hypothetical protein [Shewanella sp. Isolate11]|uniref:hypothetical protein n=1 Tax=Shewanella sp. Isolate11 TaxID=2908530 RepID=UPI001EFE247C|nr:hypothetical protein [Shewanella sp. Isolate11]MCG9697584.1 hypothetical protein [Shewanella sp. Isolate11]